MHATCWPCHAIASNHRHSQKEGALPTPMGLVPNNYAPRLITARAHARARGYVIGRGVISISAKKN